ncbi:MAG: hypothetical protein QXT19_01015 [Candidatus Woesearchaeota archaeon]
MDQPEIIRRDGNTYVTVKVAWQTPIRCMTKFYEELKKIHESGRNLLFRHAGACETSLQSDGKNIFDLLCVIAGGTLEVMVQGEDLVAENIARQIYSGLTSPNSCEFDMHRYDRK